MKRTSVIAGGALGVVALALTACASTAVSKTSPPPTAFTPAATQAPSTPAPATSGPVGTSFTVTTQNDSGAAVVYTVTLMSVDQAAGTSAYETLANPGDHMTAARFSITGVTGHATDDANNDASATGADTTEFPSSDNSVTDGPNFSYGTWSVTPGQTVSGWVSFEVPAGDKLASVAWTPDSGMGGTTATWNIGS
jgi:hypothetical protein